MGVCVKLPELNDDRVQDLVGCYELKDETIGNFIPRLIELVGGHPYLVQLALYHLWHQDVTPEQLLQEAPTVAGIYSNHLRHYLEHLLREPELTAALKKVLMAPIGVRLESMAAYKLESLGLVKLQGDEVTPSCQLYRLYFRNELGGF